MRSVSILSSIVAIFSFSSVAHAGQLFCEATAEPAQVRIEGLAERLGEIVITCTGTPGDTFETGTFSLVVSAPITNRLAGEVLPDVVMSADTSAGRIPVGGAPLLVANNVASFQRISFMVPADGRTSFRITGLRVAADQLGETAPVTVLISTTATGGLFIRNNPVTAGVARRGLLANASSVQIVCQGSPLPEEIAFDTLAGRTRSFTLRATEGAPGAFRVRDPGATQGTRVMVRYSGFPAGARLFVPDLIAGSSTTRQTSAGDLGVPVSGGIYGGLGDGLLLSRVPSPDSTGAGGFPFPLPPGALTLNSVSEVTMRNGEGVAVYEVVSENPNVLESAHIPTFVGLAAQNDGRNIVASARVSLAPLSTVRTASSSAPLPRFLDVPPELDCSILRDCNASYFPRLFVDAPALQFRVPARSTGFHSKYIRVVNDSGGVLNWGTKIQYVNGSGWLRAFPESGINTASLNLHLDADRLDPGTYQATFTVDAGPLAGTRSYNVVVEVFAPPPPQPTPPQVRESGNAASLRVQKLVPGSLATLKGERLGGTAVSVTFDGIPATVLFSSDTQINLLVPAELAGRPVASMRVTADGVANAGQLVQLSAAAPAIFAGGILNQDGFPNSPNNPALVGTIFQVFATGLPLAGQGKITAKIHDREIDVLLYGGPAPGLSGVQQVNFYIPDDLPEMTTEVLVCGVPDNDAAGRVCSPPATAVLRRLQP